jgi:ribonuclease BN (tRNA processing enzyme)/DNA-nicking Smr family endonuclease
VKLVILGSGTAIPVPHRGPTAAWVSEADTSILVDCGSGALQKLVEAGGSLQALDALLLTHAHLDHIGALPSLLFALRIPGQERRRPLPIFHSKAMSPYLEGLRTVFGAWLEPRLADGSAPAVDYRPVEVGSRLHVGSLDIETFAVRHHETSLGYRFRNRAGVTLAIPSDTGMCASLTEGVAGVDCLVIECSHPDPKGVDTHMTPSKLRELIARSRPGAVVVTHVYPEAEQVDVVAQVARGSLCDIIAGRDGLTVAITGGPSEATADAPVDGAGVQHESKPKPAPPPPPSRDIESAAPADAEPVAAPTVQPTQGEPTYDADDETTAAVWLGDEGIDAEELRALLEADLAGLDAASMARRKYGDGPPSGSPTAARRPAPISNRGGASARRWTPERLTGLRPSRQQRRLLKEAAGSRLAEVNLRGSSVEEALRALKAAAQTWSRAGVPLARVVTGKGRRSEGVPVVKLAVLNWLDSSEGRRWVGSWSPEPSADGGFGSLVLKIRS